MRETFALGFKTEILDEIFSTDNGAAEKSFAKRPAKTLVSQVKIIDTENSGNFGVLTLNGELSDRKVRQIAYELALAVDNNSVSEVKKLKQKYVDTKEFSKAKDFLNARCKHVWNICNTNDEVPKDAMRALGITNLPTLELLLGTDLICFEKHNGSHTVNIINSILNNKNMNYTFDDIYEYLKSKHIKSGCKYNFITASYLAEKLDYDREKLETLGICGKEIFKKVSLRNKLKYLIKNKFAL